MFLQTSSRERVRGGNPTIPREAVKTPSSPEVDNSDTRKRGAETLIKRRINKNYFRHKVIITSQVKENSHVENGSMT